MMTFNKGKNRLNVIQRARHAEKTTLATAREASKNAENLKFREADNSISNTAIAKTIDESMELYPPSTTATTQWHR